MNFIQLDELLYKSQIAINNIQTYIYSIDDDALLEEEIEVIHALLDYLVEVSEKKGQNR